MTAKALAFAFAIAATVAFAFVLAWGPDAPVREAGRTGTPAIGGPFTLVDGDGRTVTDADFRGRTLVVYFGYSFCPDVCPTTLAIMARAIDLLGADGEAVVPVFITVDPARDTPAVVGAYVANFHPRMVGLTGSAEQVEAAAKAYKVYYAKAETEAAAGSDEYLMDHSSIIFLIGPDGRYLDHFTGGTGADQLAAGLRAHLG
ncbi:MAG TPA: SCO family protein [Alphaproteobacteria bacterium]